MLILAQLCCLVLMVAGLAFFAGDCSRVVLGRSSGWDYVTLWRWGLAAMAAGAFGAALLSIAQAMVSSTQKPKDAKGQ
jgi:hypothetical protein